MPDLTRELAPSLLSCLACPVCGSPMRVSEGGGSLVCTAESTGREGKTHCFDGGAAGYVPLAPRHPGGGDGKDAVRARTAFLQKGYYAPAAEAVVAALKAHTPPAGLVLDAGCGEGYYSNRIAREGYAVMGVDLSKFAAEAAAKCARAARGQAPATTLFAVGSVFELPAMSGAFDTVVNIFAPCAPTEYARVLRPHGRLLVVSAGERHLYGLKEAIYDDPTLNDPRRDLPGEGDGLVPIACLHHTHRIRVEGQADIAALFSMTPYYWRTPRESHERLGALETLETEVAFDIHIFDKN